MKPEETTEPPESREREERCGWTPFDTEPISSARPEQTEKKKPRSRPIPPQVRCACCGEETDEDLIIRSCGWCLDCCYEDDREQMGILMGYL